MPDFGSLILRTGLRPPLVSAPPSLVTVPSDTQFGFNGFTWQSQSANLADSLKASADYSTLVFRTRAGENYPGAYDTSRRVRSEIYAVTQHVAVGQTLVCSGILRRSGPQLQTEWNSFVQLHADDQHSGSPCFQVGNVVGTDNVERILIDTAYRRQVDGNATQYGPRTNGPVFVRDVDHTFEVTFKDAYGSANGIFKVKFDGVTVYDYTGVTGYFTALPNTSYLKIGDHAGVENDGDFPASWNQTTTIKNFVVTVS